MQSCASLRCSAWTARSPYTANVSLNAPGLASGETHTLAGDAHRWQPPARTTSMSLRSSCDSASSSRTCPCSLGRNWESRWRTPGPPTSSTAPQVAPPPLRLSRCCRRGCHRQDTSTASPAHPQPRRAPFHSRCSARWAASAPGPPRPASRTRDIAPTSGQHVASSPWRSWPARAICATSLHPFASAPPPCVAPLRLRGRRHP
mmetsp:Transcript_25725/g.73999  ORF Transcript_25725/g.73999 Transcript_25725/m.73999 type:complete len:203 (-) Transcript_25725:279-887(-)